MNKQPIFITLVLCLLGTANALDLAVSGYSLETYAQYTSPYSPRRMAIDNNGNLYLTHRVEGKIVKIDTNKQDSVLVSNLPEAYGITWGGGTDYGNYLYITTVNDSTSGDKVIRSDLSGNISDFSLMNSPYHGPVAIAIDRTATYYNQMYVGTGSVDSIVNINLNGTVSTFTSWPGITSGGTIWSLDFDITGKYYGKMYAATSYPETNSDISGLFAINPNGTASRFCNTIVQANEIAIDGLGTYFNGDMFVVGTDIFEGTNSLWRVFEDGTCEKFMTGLYGNNAVEFGPDGSMYVSAYNWGTDEVTIVRVIPEPATLLLLATGVLYLRKRKA